MARSSKLKIMISSRCDDAYPSAGGRSLSDIRKDLKKDIESVKINGRKLFEVWINESTPPQAGSWDSWAVCMNAVRDCDILISLSNGNAGWVQESGEIGICHAELMTGLSLAPAKVRLILLGNIAIKRGPEGDVNRRFQDYINGQNIFRGGSVTDETALKGRVIEAIIDALISLAQAGVRDSRLGSFSSGQALDWTRLDFRGRRDQIRSVIKDAVRQRKGSALDQDQLVARIAGTDIVIIADAIPAALSVVAARELVGQPFLSDHKLAPTLKGKRGGPVHIIGCHKGATETQAIKLLGFPDATVVNAPFGIFVADNIQKVQFAFIVNCRDDANTRHGVQRFFTWLEQTGEDKMLASRAKSRANIVKAIASEVGT